jgi:hypothetical protein
MSFNLLKHRSSQVSLIFIASFLSQLAAMDPGLNPYDEGIILVGADQILAGRLPYRDFWTMYGPGQFYVIATLFHFFGEYAVVERLFDVLLRSITVVVCFQLTNRVASKNVALICTLSVWATLISAGAYAFPIFAAIALTAIAALFILRSFYAAYSFSNFFLAGIFIGLAALFRQDLGFYAILAGSVGLIIDRTLFPRPQCSMSIFLIVSILGLGSAVIVVPALIVLVLQVPAPDLYQNLVQIPATVYPKVRGLPFPNIWMLLHNGFDGDYRSLEELAIYIPPVATAAAAVLFATSVKERTRTDQALSTAAFFVTLVALFYVKGLVRVSTIHMVQAIIFSLVLAATCSSLSAAKKPWGSAILALLSIFSAIPLLAFCYQAAITANSNLAGYSLYRLCRIPETTRLVCLRTSSDILAAANFIKQTTAQSDRIYVGAGRHDKLYINDLILYFVAERLPATKWSDLHPGIQTTEETQLKMIAEFEAAPPSAIVIESAFDGADEPNGSRKSSGVKILDDYLERNFSKAFSSNTITVLTPKFGFEKTIDQNPSR